MHYKWLLFDADGTLFDYDKAESTALKETFQLMGTAFSPAYLDAYRRINQRIWRELEAGRISPQDLRVRRFDLLFHTINLSLSSEAFSDVYLRQLSACSQLLDGITDILQVLHAKYELAIVTNGLKDVQRPRLEHSAISRYFQLLVISEEVGAAKPDAAFFDAAFQRMGQPRKDEVLMIGDSLSADILGGYRYGIGTCWYNPTRLPGNPEWQSTYEIEHLSDLLCILA